MTMFILEMNIVVFILYCGLCLGRVLLSMKIGKIRNSGTLGRSTVLEIRKNQISRTLGRSIVLEIAKNQISGTQARSTVLEITKNQISRTQAHAILPSPTKLKGIFPVQPIPLPQ